MFTEDISAFFSTADFATTASFAGGADVPVIFDAAAVQGSVGPLGMVSAMPAITLPSAQVPASPVGVIVVVTVDGATVSYVVADAQPDGTGITRLLLEVA
ncbi:hypothetical protein LJR074_002594 [Acidovorax sp. LjRoot74]|uniref:head-tail joining protein n=1 Tax=Acidovorax sp. LjRoot74 TaxID=3342337 RepID=UPI003ECCB755